MKHYLNILLLMMLLFSCHSKTEIKENPPKKESIENMESSLDSIAELKNNQVDIKKEEAIAVPPVKSETIGFIIDDEAQYSKNFIAEIRAANGIKQVEFNKGKMILNQRDSIQFPETPRLNQSTTLTARKENLAIALIIERINYTSIEYRIEMVEFGKSHKMESGIADLGAFFFLGSESDTYDFTNESYFSTEYSSEKDSCYLNIRVGRLEDASNQALLAKWR